MESRAITEGYRSKVKRETTPIKLVLSHDSEIVRRGLQALCEAEPDMKIIGEADDGPAALKQVKKLHPDVLVVDLMMNGMSGLAATKHASRRSPKTSVIIYSKESDEPFVLEALRSGARGYVLIESTASELVRAIREVASGSYYLSRPLLERAIRVYAGKARTSEHDLYDTLTVREQDILLMASQKLTSQEIAERLGISRRTVEVHRRHVRRKLGLSRQPDEIIRYAIQNIYPSANRTSYEERIT